MKITKELVDTAKAHFLSIDEMAHIWDTYFVEHWNVDVTPASINKLTRMGVLNSKGEVTEAGESIIMLVVDIPPVEKTEETVLAKFEEFWKIYPRDDAYNTFGKTRQLRWNKSETRKLFIEYAKEHSEDVLIEALKREIKFRSSPSQENLFKYMTNSVNWFKKNSFETFLTDDNDPETNEYGKEIS